MIEPDAVPEVVAPPGWTLGPLIAIGGTARVYSVQRGSSPPAIMKWSRWRDRDIRARFAEEAKVLQGVGAPSTPAYIEHGAVGEWPYLIMEYVAGETLASWMSRTGERGGLGEILAIVTRIVTALSALHQAGYVHRDLKPENISIGPRGARLLDFGLAKRLDAPPEITQIGYVVGTVHYLAPEQIRTGSSVDQRADIYSFGVIAFEMLAGRPPFVGERRAIEYQHQVCHPPSVRETRSIPKALDELVLACLAKQPEARPQSADELRTALANVFASLGTLRGLGALTEPKPLGTQSQVAMTWIVGGDPVLVTRAINHVNGIVVRQRGDGILAAFSALHHNTPLSVALAACPDLLRERCRIVVHVAEALVRRTAQGRLTVYGKDIEHVEQWTPAVPFTGLLLTAAAAELANGATPAPDVAGFFRERDTAAADATGVEGAPTLVGRSTLVDKLATALARPSILVGISGSNATGKTRVLDAIVDKLRASGREVVTVRARRRFDGDRPDDDGLLSALGGDQDFVAALDDAGRRGIVVAIDDAHRLSTALRDAVLRPDLLLSRIVVGPDPLFEVLDGTANRIAVDLPPLSYPDAAVLLRDQLRPARLIPDILVERLTLRGAGNPGLLVALARDMKRRGAIRHHTGSDDWYVAVDELDTLLAPPGPSWLAVSAIESLPFELAPVARGCAGLGPRMCAGEVAAVVGVSDAEQRLSWLVTKGVLLERSGWYEFVDSSLQDAIYDFVLDERDLVHKRAFEYWIAHRAANLVGWLARLAYHGARAGETTTAAACSIALARERQRAGEADHADQLLSRALAYFEREIAPEVVEALHLIEPS